MSKIQKNINTFGDVVTVEIVRRDSDSLSTVLGTFKYNCLTAEFSGKWSVDGSNVLSIAERFSLDVWFWKFIIKLF